MSIMQSALQWALILTCLEHMGCLVFPRLFRNKTEVVDELVLQHHEKCVLFSLIGLAIVFK